MAQWLSENLLTVRVMPPYLRGYKQPRPITMTRAQWELSSVPQTAVTESGLPVLSAPTSPPKDSGTCGPTPPQETGEP